MEKEYKNNLILRLFTSIGMIFFVLLITLSANLLIFSLSIILICVFAIYEWKKNNFGKHFLGLFIISNFGFWSIFFVSYSGITSPILDAKNDYFFYYIYLLIIMNTSIFDTAAFLIGSNYGKTFITKKISPKKTLEGLIGGLFGNLITGVTLFMMFNTNLWVIFICITGGIFAFFGDLLISYLKRQNGIKDTGDILPGHGGILDRLDSHLLSTPITIMLILVLTNISSL